MTPPLSSRSWIPESSGESGGGDSPSGRFIGPDAVASGVFAVIGANFDEYHVDPSDYIDQGSRVVVKGRFSGKNKGGAMLNTGFEHVFDMVDGRVVRFDQADDAESEEERMQWTNQRQLVGSRWA
jgi:uncharacterized protein